MNKKAAFPFDEMNRYEWHYLPLAMVDRTGIGLKDLDDTQNDANHIHSVWRDFNGDYGRDLLNEHYHGSHHHK